MTLIFLTLALGLILFYFFPYNFLKALGFIPYIIYKRIGVSGDQLVDANPSMDQYNQPVVSLRFDSTGSRKFGDLTSISVSFLARSQYGFNHFD